MSSGGGALPIFQVVIYKEMFFGGGMERDLALWAAAKKY